LVPVARCFRIDKQLRTCRKTPRADFTGVADQVDTVGPEEPCSSHGAELDGTRHGPRPTTRTGGFLFLTLILAPLLAVLVVVKGYFLSKVMYGADRLTQPLLRMRDGKLDKYGDFVPVSWDQAFDVMAEKCEQTNTFVLARS
jgi:hypothetical protein